VDESSIINVFFDPNYAGDKQSDTIKQKLVLTYKEHPQKDAIDLFGAINFPNISLDSNKVDFGAVLNGSEKRQSLVMTNSSKIDADFSWSFVVAGQEELERISSLFDVLPFRGTLKPGQSETTEFVFKGAVDQVAKAKIVCQVDGGPEYPV
jgi:hydrocephalus-inducing protein